MNIITVVGARPQFIKAATVSRSVLQHKKNHSDSAIVETIVHTGQHYDANMSDVFFEEMDIPKPKFTLGIGGGTHGAMTGRQLEKLEEIFLSEKPDGVIVYGDTNSTLAGALSAAKLHIPVYHIEAGLRSFNMRMPEEINRILTDQISTTLFCPTETAVQNLIREGFGERDCEIHNVGDVMYDAAMYYSPKSVKPHQLLEDVIGSFALMTIHRAENTDDPKRIKGIVAAINEIAKDVTVICPLHPRTRNVIEGMEIHCQATFLDPVSYFEMIWLLQNCSSVLTDSGGLQKEAYFFKKPCITMRDQTEWVELIDEGANILVGADFDLITEAFTRYNGTPLEIKKNLYGDAKAADKIVTKIVNGISS